MDFQQSHRYMRPPPPPPPSAADPHLQPPPLRQPVPPPGPWYSGQFQYQPPSQHSPSPPPPPQHQWPPPPSSHSDHALPPPYAAAPPPSVQPYPAPPLHNQYPPPPPPPPPHASHPYRPHVPPPYHPHSQIPQSYSQDWGSANWGHHQGWEYAGHHNEEDWAAKARAWAAAKAAIDNQHPQSQFTPVIRVEEQSHYHDQYPQTGDAHYSDILQPSLPTSSYQQYPAPVPPPQRPPSVPPQESASISSGQGSFVLNEHSAYGAREGNFSGDSNAVFPHQQSPPTSSSVHLQEVPSSYSSVAGKEDTGDQSEKFYKPFPLPTDPSQGLHHMHPPLPAVGRSVSMEQPHYAVGNQGAEFPTDLSDRPLEFVHRFNHDSDPLAQPNYTRNDSGGPLRGVDAVAAAPANTTWTPPAVPGAVYPPILSSGQQNDPSIAVPSPVPGHSAPLFARMPTSAFQPTIPSVGAPFGIGTGTGLHGTTAFPGDVFGVSDRPKKASVPNWLREEIIKKKAVIGTAGSEHSKEDTDSVENEAFGKSLGKADQADSKSLDSSRSTEEEDDDEDDIEATRTAAINQEIKRILTEVLLKVTDELFDEIATKVLSEEDLTVEVDQNIVAPNQKPAPPAQAVSTPKAFAKVIIPAKVKATETEDESGKSTSSSPGDVLGLASYASDDEDDDNTVHQQPSKRKLSEDKYKINNGNSLAETEGHIKGLRNTEGREQSDHNVGSRHDYKSASKIVESEDSIDGDKKLEGADDFKTSCSAEDTLKKTEQLEDTAIKKPLADDSQGRETRYKHDKDDRRETKRSSSGKDMMKEFDIGKDKTGERENESHRRQDEKHAKKERTDEKNGSRDKSKDQGGKSGEKVKESESKKKSTHPDGKEDRKEKERDRRGNAKEDSDRRKERTKDDKGERSKYKLSSESSRHKRRRSSSAGSRGRSSKDNSVINDAGDSSDESSDTSKRRLHFRRRNLSPSPNRSRRRYHPIVHPLHLSASPYLLYMHLKYGYPPLVVYNFQFGIIEN
ncbi:hypothetical protein NMG60_11030816 [Bertholletia excelsa]